MQNKLPINEMKPCDWLVSPFPGLHPTDMVDRSHLNQKDMKKCKLFASLITKGVQNVHHLHGYMGLPGDAFFTGQLQCQ